jgi:hypothetical protein
MRAARDRVGRPPGAQVAPHLGTRLAVTAGWRPCAAGLGAAGYGSPGPGGLRRARPARARGLRPARAGIRR